MSGQTREQKMDAARIRMAELGAKFLHRTEGDIAAMRYSLERVASGDLGALGDIQHLAHRMVGTGATLGFESLSECAQRIEKITEHCSPGVLPDETIRRQISVALDALDADFRKKRGA